MVIGFDGSRAFVNKRTGTENYSFQLLRALARIDKKNNYIIYTGNLVNSGDIRWPDNFTFKQISWPRFWTQGGLALQSFKDSLNLLFIPAHTLPILRPTNLKTIITVHDLGAEYLPKLHQLRQLIYLKYITKYQLRSATKLIAVSNATKEDLIKRVGISPKKIAVIYEGYDNKLFKPIKGDTLVNSLIEFNLKPQSYFLFVGTVQPRKNLSSIIKAFGKLESRVNPSTSLGTGSQESRKKRSRFSTLATSHLKLAIVGSKGWMSDDIYKLPKKLGIDHGVNFLGHVPDEKLPILYSGALSLVFPSLFEGFGLPIIEAQACGCPVLTSNLSSMPEVAGKGAILVDPYSMNDIVKGMNRIKNQESRIKNIKAGFENIKRFSWEKAAKETLAILEEI